MEAGCPEIRYETGWTTMSTKIVRSIIPIAPVSYDSAYLNQLARALDNVIEDQRNPLVTLSNIPNVSAANGLSIGDLYEENGFLKIVTNGDIFGGTTLGTTAVGTVTVVIS